jgi:hypothetical protein
MRKLFSLLVSLLIVGLSSWVYGASPETYSPLKEGMVWEFQHKFLDLKTNEQIGVAKSTKENLAPVELKGNKVIPQIFSFYQPATVLKQKTKSFIAKDSSGYYVFASESLEDKEPKILAEKFYILKFPLTKGASWKQQAEGLLLHNTIESTDATVQVPAGTFINCLLVKKLYFSQKDPDNAVQEALFWFAPDVGNVKVVIKNPPQHKEIVQELVSFQK